MGGNRYNSQNTVVTFEDSIGTSLTIGPGEGNFTLGEMNAENKDIVQKFDRGTHDGWVCTVDKTQAWSITVEQRNEAQTSAVAARIKDWLRKANFYSGLQSVATGSPLTIWAFKVIVTMDDGTTTSTTTLPECPALFTFAEGVEGHTIAISGLNALAPVYT